jgi:hypothetical protein
MDNEYIEKPDIMHCTYQVFIFPNLLDGAIDIQ